MRSSCAQQTSEGKTYFSIEKFVVHSTSHGGCTVSALKLALEISQVNPKELGLQGLLTTDITAKEKHQMGSRSSYISLFVFGRP